MGRKNRATITMVLWTANVLERVEYLAVIERLVWRTGSTRLFSGPSFALRSTTPGRALAFLNRHTVMHAKHSIAPLAHAIFSRGVVAIHLAWIGVSLRCWSRTIETIAMLEGEPQRFVDWLGSSWPSHRLTARWVAQVKDQHTRDILL